MWERDGFVISTDKSALNIDTIHRFIAEDSYWGQGRSREAVEETLIWMF